MARFWVSGTGTWDTSTTTHWSASSGGAGGASVPGLADDVKFDANSGGGVVTISGSGGAKTINSVDCTGFTGTFAAVSSPQISPLTSLNLAGKMLPVLYFAGGSNTITSGGGTVGSMTVNAGVGTCTIADNLIVSGVLTLVGGIINAGGHNVTLGSLAASGSTSRTLTLGAGTWTLTGTGTVWDTTGSNITVTHGGETIAITDASAATKTFKGNGSAFSFSLSSAHGTVALDLGAAGSWTFSADLSNANLTLELVTGTLNANGHVVSIATFKADSGAVGLTMGAVTWTLSGTGTVFDIAAAATMALSLATLIAISDASAATKTFADTGRAYSSSLFSFSGSGVFDFALGSGSLTLSGDLSVTGFSVTTGTFNANGHNITLTGTGTVWNMAAAATWTASPATTIKINDASAATKTFAGGGHTYNALWLTGAGSGAFILTGSNTFGTFTLDTPPHDVQFESGSTQIATTLSISGSASGLMTLEPVGAAAWNLTCLAGISASYLALRGSHAHGGAFIAANSFDAGDNTNWDFVRSSSTAIYLDSAYQYTGAAIATVESLNWLIGETLGVLADGVDIGDATVDSHGRLVLPDGLSHSAITVGKRYLSRGVTLRAPTAGNQDGSALARPMVIKQAFADILDTGYLGVGSLAGVEAIPPPYRQTNPGDLYTGMYEASIDDSHLNEGIIVFETDRAYPATLRALQMGIESEP